MRPISLNIYGKRLTIDDHKLFCLLPEYSCTSQPFYKKKASLSLLSRARLPWTEQTVSSYISSVIHPDCQGFESPSGQTFICQYSV